MSELSKETLESILSRTGDYLRTLLTDPGALRGQHLRGGGPVKEFEQLLAERCGFPYCLATANATSALTVAAFAAELEGETVLADSHAWTGSLGALEAAGVEIQALTTAQSATLASNAGGFAAVLASDPSKGRHNQERVRALCNRYRILYIEDTNRLPGITCTTSDYSLADIQVLSFGPGKPLCLGEGGALLLRDRSLYEKAIQLSQHPERVVHEGLKAEKNLICNARMHPIAALVGCQLLRNWANDSLPDYKTGEERIDESGFPDPDEDLCDADLIGETLDTGMKCSDCGLSYPFEGLIVMLPDEQWKTIYPENGGQGVLCANCIAERATKVEGAVRISASIESLCPSTGCREHDHLIRFSFDGAADDDL